MAQSQLAQLQDAAATAIANCAAKVDTFSFETLSNMPGIEICNDPEVGGVFNPVA